MRAIWGGNWLLFGFLAKNHGERLTPAGKRKKRRRRYEKPHIVTSLSVVGFRGTEGTPRGEIGKTNAEKAETFRRITPEKIKKKWGNSKGTTRIHT